MQGTCGEKVTKQKAGSRQNLGDGVQVGAILKQQFNDFDTILLASNVQRSEAVLTDRQTDTHTGITYSL